DNADAPRSGRDFRTCRGGSRRAYCVFHRPGANLDGEIVLQRAGHRHHQGGGVAEVALKLNTGCAARQLRRQRLQLGIDVAELFLRIRDILRKIHIYKRNAWQRDRTNAVVLRRSGVNGLVLRDGLLDRPRDQLLHFLSCRARPLADRYRYPNRYIRVLALRHRKVTVDSPNYDGYEYGPGDLPVLDEKTRGVVFGPNQLLVGFMRHGMLLREVRGLPGGRGRAIRRSQSASGPLGGPASLQSDYRRSVRFRLPARRRIAFPRVLSEASPQNRADRQASE